MKSILSTLMVTGLILAIAPHVQAQGQQRPEGAQPPELAELEAKISKSLKSDRRNDASAQYVRAIWDDYKQEYIANEKSMNFEGRSTTASDVESYDDYVGKYKLPGTPDERVEFEIEKLPSGRYVVHVEGHTIPAVALNKSIYFTTGDVVVDSTLPPLAGKGYATLEMLLVRRIQGQFYVADELTLLITPVGQEPPGRAKREKIGP